MVTDHYLSPVRFWYGLFNSADIFCFPIYSRCCLFHSLEMQNCIYFNSDSSRNGTPYDVRPYNRRNRGECQIASYHFAFFSFCCTNYTIFFTSICCCCCSSAHLFHEFRILCVYSRVCRFAQCFSVWHFSVWSTF